MTDQTSYAVGAGYNVPLISLYTLTKVTVSPDTRPFFAPLGRGFYDPGSPKYRTNAMVFDSGFSAITWQFDILTFAQYWWLYNTILSGARSGPVTAYTRVGNNPFTRMNTVMILPRLTEQDASIQVIKKAKVKLARLRTAS